MPGREVPGALVSGSPPNSHGAGRRPLTGSYVHDHYTCALPERGGARRLLRDPETVEGNSRTLSATSTSVSWLNAPTDRCRSAHPRVGIGRLPSRRPGRPRTFHGWLGLFCPRKQGRRIAPSPLIAARACRPTALIRVQACEAPSSDIRTLACLSSNAAVSCTDWRATSRNTTQ